MRPAGRLKPVCLAAPCAVLDAVPVSIEGVREHALLRDSGRAATALELRRANVSYVKLERVGDNLTKVSIRVDTFGDRPLSMTVLDKIKAKL